MRSRASWFSAVFAALLVVGCSDRTTGFEYSFFSMGTEVTLTFYGIPRQRADSTAAHLEHVYNRIAQEWYPWSDGELQAINAAIANSESVRVSGRLRRLIRRAAELESSSGGRFHAGLGHLSEIWGLQPVIEDLAEPPNAERIASLIDDNDGARSLCWNEGSIVCADANVMLDLGAIAKGGVLMLSVQYLVMHGIDNAIVNIGGDLVVLGDVDGRSARIGIRSPFSDAPIAGLDAESSEAVVTSGNYERFVEIDGKRYTHIFDPRTGYPVLHTASVTVVDSDPVLADAAATALLVGGPDEFDEIVAAMHLTYALLIDAQGDIRLTPNMADRLHWAEPHEPR